MVYFSRKNGPNSVRILARNPDFFNKIRSFQIWSISLEKLVRICSEIRSQSEILLTHIVPTDRLAKDACVHGHLANHTTYTQMSAKQYWGIQCD